MSNEYFYLNAGVLTIKEGIKEIPNYAFEASSFYKKIVEVNLPNGIKRIGKCAFWGQKIKKINIPNTVLVIDEYALGSNFIENIILPDDLIYLGKGSFSLNKLTEIKIPSKITTIENNTFYGNKLEKLYIPDNIESIGYAAFWSNKELEYVEIPRNCIIEEDAFDLKVKIYQRNSNKELKRLL